MDMSMREDACRIVTGAIRAVLPDEAVRRALEHYRPGGGRTILVAAGKAAWQMARAAVEAVGPVDGDTASALRKAGLDIDDVLQNNDAYRALKTVNGLIITGPTGTNVNDVAVVLLRPVEGM